MFVTGDTAPHLKDWCARLHWCANGAKVVVSLPRRTEARMTKAAWNELRNFCADEARDYEKAQDTARSKDAKLVFFGARGRIRRCRAEDGRARGAGVMETHEALAEAVKFLDDYNADDFGSAEAFVAAAILWGERIGTQRMRETALSAVAEARDEILDLLTVKSWPS